MSSSLTEAEWAELAAEELARADDPVIRQYEASRAKVLEEEDRQRSGLSSTRRGRQPYEYKGGPLR